MTCYYLAKCGVRGRLAKQPASGYYFRHYDDADSFRNKIHSVYPGLGRLFIIECEIPSRATAVVLWNGYGEGPAVVATGSALKEPWDDHLKSGRITWFRKLVPYPDNSNK